jgi:hypothetical protein
VVGGMQRLAGQVLFQTHLCSTLGVIELSVLCAFVEYNIDVQLGRLYFTSRGFDLLAPDPGVNPSCG